MEHIESTISKDEKKVLYCLYRCMLTGERLVYKNAGEAYLWLRETFQKAIEQDSIDLQKFILWDTNIHNGIIEKGDTVEIIHNELDKFMDHTTKTNFMIDSPIESVNMDPDKEHDTAKFWANQALDNMTNSSEYFSEEAYEQLECLISWVDGEPYKTIKYMDRVMYHTLESSSLIIDRYNPLINSSVVVNVFNPYDHIFPYDHENIIHSLNMDNQDNMNNPDIIDNSSIINNKLNKVYNVNGYYSIYRNGNMRKLSTYTYNDIDIITTNNTEFFETYYSILQSQLNPNTIIEIKKSIKYMPQLPMDLYLPLVKPMLNKQMLNCVIKNNDLLYSSTFVIPSKDKYTITDWWNLALDKEY